MLKLKMDIGFSEMWGEIKRVEEKLIGIDKRLGNEEFIVRGAIVTVLGGIATAFAKQTFFT